MESAAQIYAKHIRAMLRGGPAKALTLAEGLRVSQPTISRTIKALGDEVISVGAARAVFYVLRDDARAHLQVPVFRVNEDGNVLREGLLVPVRPEGFVLLRELNRAHSEGLPWWIADALPQGYMGRAFAKRYLRREEAAMLTMGSFEPSPQGWNIKLVGKGGKKATIVATSKLMDELRIYRTSLGLSPLPAYKETLPAILAVTGKDKGVTAQAIYLICKEIFKMAAALVKDEDKRAAQRLMLASPHWMRHTGVSHTMEAGVDPRYVQAQARHSSLKVTARYDHKRRQAWRNALEAASDKGSPRFQCNK